ncbi:hypothetical protein GB937_010527 [Aspergillus fischeri]|nr:hypothetical protein GB937_010527 [Aspergillus fischeri]
MGLISVQKHFIPHINSYIQGRFQLLILNGYGSHLTRKFNQICAENNIIPLYMPSHSLHLLNVGCFTVLKHAYSHFISDLARRGYNHINKLDFLDNY